MLFLKKGKKKEYFSETMQIFKMENMKMKNNSNKKNSIYKSS